MTDAEADARTIAFVSQFLAGIGLDTRLGAHGVTAAHLDALVVQAFEDPCHATNAVPVTRDDFRALYLEVI